MKLRDRIKDFRRVPAAALRPSPRNWRTHPNAQKDALRGVLAEIGIADAVLARELPDGELELIDGHLRAETMLDQMIPVLVLDVDENEAGKILATLDPLGAMAEADADKLDSLLRDVQTESQAVADMLTKLAERSGLLTSTEERSDEPEVPEGNYAEQYGVIVMCRDAAHQEEVYNKLQEQGYQAKVVTT